MKGDNNNIEDKARVTKDNIVGTYVNQINNAADFYYFIKSSYGVIAIIGVPLFIYMVLSLIIYIKAPEKGDTSEKSGDTSEKSGDTTEANVNTAKAKNQEIEDDNNAGNE